MEQRGLGSLGKVSDPVFRFAILMVGSNAAERDCLVLRLHVIDESFVCKSAVVTMVMLDRDAMVLGVPFEGRFRLDGFFGR